MAAADAPELAFDFEFGGAYAERVRVSPLRVAIVGCGLIGAKRAAALARAGDELIACHDVDPHATRRLAERHGCRAVRDARRAARRWSREVVIVATVHDRLAELAERALAAGAHVLVEKPAGVSSAQIERLIECQRRLRAPGQGRLQPPLPSGSRARRRRRSTAGATASCCTCAARYGHGGRPGYEREWRADPARSGGGELVDQGMHLLDLSHWLAGPLPLHSALLRTEFWDTPVEDNAALILGEPRTRTGPWAMLHVSWTEWKNLFSLEVYCRTREAPGRRARRLLRAAAPADLPHGPRARPARRWRSSPTPARTAPGRPSGSTSPAPSEPATGGPCAATCGTRVCLGAGRGRLCRGAASRTGRGGRPVSGALAGRAALITGGSRGLGLEIARAYLEAGASGVCICGRDAGALRSAAAELSELAGPGRPVLAEVADVSAPDDVERLMELAVAGLGDLQIVVSNAGVYGPKGRIDRTDRAEWARAVEINLFGSVLIARAAAAHLVGRGYGKIIQLSGGGATRPLPGLSAYSASKAAVVRFAETLACELREHRVDVNAIAPGALNTRMLDELLAAGPERVGEEYYERALAQRERGGDPLRGAADLAVFLGSAASDGVTGKLLSAVWDPWPRLPEHLGELDSDLYTLRRIVPRDRGLDWGGA